MKDLTIKKAIRRVDRVVRGAFEVYLDEPTGGNWKNYRALEMALDALIEKEETK